MEDVVLNPAGQPASTLVQDVMAQYGIEQGEVAFREGGTWLHVSERSATIAVETDLRTRTVLEYGENERFDQRIEDEDLHYIHIFHLPNLVPDTEYQCRVMAEDRRGERAESAVIALKTTRLPEAIRIPEGMPGPPYVLDREGAYYLLAEDLTAPGTGLQIEASGITLDLGGHVVVYNEERSGLEADDIGIYLEQAAFGIRGGRGVRNLRVLNGTVMQGKGQDRAGEETVGFNPMLLDEVDEAEIAGLMCIYEGTQLSGIVCRRPGSDVQIHHNVIEDRGRRIDNRHKMCCAIRLTSEEGGAIFNNLVKRARQSALGNAGKNVHIHHNELHIDSHSINSFGIGAKDGCLVHDNRVFGCGDNVVALATTGGCEHVELYGNYIWLHAHDISAYLPDLNTREMESSDVSVMSGVRITWGCDDVDYHDNVVLVTAREGGLIRGTFLFNDANAHNARFRDNLVVAIAEDEDTHGWGAIAGVGNEMRGPTEPMLFAGNTIVSNFTHFSMQDTYGVSINYRFVGNTFVRVGDRSDYATIRAREVRPSREHVFLDNHFEGGAGYDRCAIGEEDEFTVQWALEVRAAPGASVSIRDASGREPFSGDVGEEGRLVVPLVYYRQEGSRREERGPYAVTIRKGSQVEEFGVQYPMSNIQCSMSKGEKGA